MAVGVGAGVSGQPVPSAAGCQREPRHRFPGGRAGSPLSHDTWTPSIFQKTRKPPAGARGGSVGSAMSSGVVARNLGWGPTSAQDRVWRQRPPLSGLRHLLCKLLGSRVLSCPRIPPGSRRSWAAKGGQCRESGHLREFKLSVGRGSHGVDQGVREPPGPLHPRGFISSSTCGGTVWFRDKEEQGRRSSVGTPPLGAAHADAATCHCPVWDLQSLEFRHIGDVQASF